MQSLISDPNVKPISVCGLGGALPPVSGELDGSPDADPDYVWLMSDGRRVLISWPAGFRVRWQPALEILNEDGSVVAHKGDTVTLPQVIKSEHSGESTDRYPAVGQVGPHCYGRAGRG